LYIQFSGPGRSWFILYETVGGLALTIPVPLLNQLLIEQRCCCASGTERYPTFLWVVV